MTIITELLVNHENDMSVSLFTTYLNQIMELMQPEIYQDFVHGYRHMCGFSTYTGVCYTMAARGQERLIDALLHNKFDILGIKYYNINKRVRFLFKCFTSDIDFNVFDSAIRGSYIQLPFFRDYHQSFYELYLTDIPDFMILINKYNYRSIHIHLDMSFIEGWAASAFNKWAPLILRGQYHKKKVRMLVMAFKNGLEPVYTFDMLDYIRHPIQIIDYDNFEDNINKYVYGINDKDEMTKTELLQMVYSFNNIRISLTNIALRVVNQCLPSGNEYILGVEMLPIPSIVKDLLTRTSY